MFDNNGEDIAQYIYTCTEFIEKAKHYSSILVHCNQGVSRSTSIVLGYLMLKKGMGLQEAYDMVKSKRKQAGPNTNFRKQLEKFEL